MQYELSTSASLTPEIQGSRETKQRDLATKERTSEKEVTGKTEAIPDRSAKSRSDCVGDCVVLRAVLCSALPCFTFPLSLLWFNCFAFMYLLVFLFCCLVLSVLGYVMFMYYVV